MGASVVPLFTETWEERALRLARLLKAEHPDPFKSSPKQRQRYQLLRYAMQRHIEDVPA